MPEPTSPTAEPTDDIAVTVVGGYLGSGKTTLVNHVLASADDRLAVIVNDFGDINVDAALIDAADESTISLANGCICCSLVDGFAAALDTVNGLVPRPQRLLIETSGVALPHQVSAWAHQPGFHLDATVVVADAETVRELSGDRYVGDTVRSQLEAGDVLITNKVDLVSADELSALNAWLCDVNDRALVLPAEHGAVDLRLLFAVTGAVRLPSSAPTQPDFASRTIELRQPVDRMGFERFMDELPPSILRVKGWVLLSDDPDRSFLVQRVGRRWTLTRSDRLRPSALVIIATDPAALDHTVLDPAILRLE